MDHITRKLIVDVSNLSEGFRKVVAEHISDQCGEMLPHLLFSDLTRYVVSLLATRSGPDEIRAFLELMERALDTKEPYVTNLIGVSFVEELTDDREAIRRLWPLLGEQVRADFRENYSDLL